MLYRALLTPISFQKTIGMISQCCFKKAKQNDFIDLYKARLDFHAPLPDQSWTKTTGRTVYTSLRNNYNKWSIPQTYSIDAMPACEDC